MKRIFTFLTLLVSLFLYSQGCSDAGFCTMDNMKIQKTDSIQYKSEVKLGLNYGLSYEDINVFGAYVAYLRNLYDKFNVDLRVNYFSQFNDDFSSSALSDAIVSTNYKINPSTKATLGFKIPFTDGNLKENGIALPMDFQPSLGTFDVIVGFSKRISKLGFALAYQQPLTQNKNQYFAPAGSRFTTTNQFKRAGDVLLRAYYSFYLSEKLTFSPSLLPIYHVSEDKYTDLYDVERKIEGSDGLTLNANLFFNYKLSKNQSFEFSLGGPLVVREVRPDGLTRGAVANLEYKILF